MTEPRTHNYGPGHRTWGHDYSITQTIDGGQRLKVSGWGPIGGHIRQGDYLLLQKDRDRDTRYQVTEIRYDLDPNDMWHATLDFAPRQASKEPQ
ncbi:hypothetical protein ACWGB8_01715 [Kitasatospora sp. NPDC054939]